MVIGYQKIQQYALPPSHFNGRFLICVDVNWLVGWGYTVTVVFVFQDLLGVQYASKICQN